MEVKSVWKKLRATSSGLAKKLKGVFVKENGVSEKMDVNFKSFKIIGLMSLFVFIGVVFLLPDDVQVEFTEKIDRNASAKRDSSSETNSGEKNQDSATQLWSSPRSEKFPPGGSGDQVNYNTSMVLGSKSGNAKTQLRAGIRMPLRILDKVTVSQESVPVLAELILDSQTESGLKIPAGTRFYGEASFQRGAERATVRFTQLSLPSGQIRKISALALGKDGQPGVEGRVFSHGMKNTAGQVLTTFVGGLASGSMETDILGRSKGGVTNGLLAAVSATAQDRAQAYGEKLKTEREWIELSPGVECDATLTESLKLQEGGDENER